MKMQMPAHQRLEWSFVVYAQCQQNVDSSHCEGLNSVFPENEKNEWMKDD